MRKVPGALALGLLASSVAHAMLFRGSHAMGGPYHALFVQIALAAGTGVFALLSGLALVESRDTAEGSIVACRLRRCLPNFAAVMASAGAWYTLAEAVEPQHAGVSPLFAIVALAASAWLVIRLAFATAHAIGAAAFAIRQAGFAPRLPVRKRRQQVRPLSRRPLLARRRFARPPPPIIAA